jgi:hypothetical protein
MRRIIAMLRETSVLRILPLVLLAAGHARR